MKTSINSLVYQLAVIALSLFIVGCSDDDTTPDSGSDKLTDVDGNEYQTLIIGSQEWMAENLRVTRYQNGHDIPTGLNNTDWGNTTEGAYAIYDHDHWSAEGINSSQAMVDAYGKLYNWYAIDDSRGLCPEGWSVPDNDDWQHLIDYIVAQGLPNESDNPDGAGYALRSCRQVESPLGGNCDTTVHPRWNHAAVHGFDEFGFAALPGGIRGTSSYGQMGNMASWWSSSELSPSSPAAWIWEIRIGNGNLNRIGYGKDFGMSVRCVREVDK